MVLAVLWVVVASVIALMPVRLHKPSAIWFLIPTALTLLPWLYVTSGWVAALLFLLGACSILRWPVYFLSRFIGQKTRGVLGR
jgi:hypothetical protein